MIKKVFNFLNESRFDLSSLLLKEEEESTEETEETEDAGEETEEKSGSESESSESESEKDTKDLDDLKQKVEDDAAKLKYDALERKEAEMASSYGELDRIQDNILNVENYTPYFFKKGSIKNFLFEEDNTVAIEMLKDVESKTIPVPLIVKNSIEMIRYFDSKVDKVKLIYNIAIKGIIEKGGVDFKKEIEQFNDEFHRAFTKEFPDQESPVMKSLDNQNYHYASDANIKGQG